MLVSVLVSMSLTPTSADQLENPRLVLDVITRKRVARADEMPVCHAAFEGRFIRVEFDLTSHFPHPLFVTKTLRDPSLKVKPYAKRISANYPMPQ